MRYPNWIDRIRSSALTLLCDLPCVSGWGAKKSGNCSVFTHPQVQVRFCALATLSECGIFQEFSRKFDVDWLLPYSETP